MMERIKTLIILLIASMITSLVHAQSANVTPPPPEDVIKLPLPPQKTGATDPVVRGPVALAPNALTADKAVPPEMPPATTALKVETLSPVVCDTRQTSGLISFYFQNIAIKSLLQLIAKNSGLNFIISDNVKGDTTLNLKNVTWHQALDIILHSNGLASRQIGTALFISTLEDIAQKQAKEYEAEENAANMAPLATAYISLNYSDAEVIAKVLKSSEGSLLTTRGNVTINVPDNSIIVRDVRRNVAEIKKFILKMDVPARQVSIEARIVNFDTTYEAQLGVRFGLSNTRSLSGTLVGASQLANGVSVSSISPVDERLNFNVPASILSTQTVPASIGLALARLGPVLLDLELSALEEDGHIEIISKPRVVTANQQKAMIQTGEEIPYQNSTSSGATATEFKKAVLSLEIIPQITPDDKIILRLKATQDSRGEQLLVAQGSSTSSTSASTSSGSTANSVSINTPAVYGPPTINTQEVQSYVVLNDNETVVIGGIYKLSKQNTYDRVPFFGSLPLIGPLFRHRGIKNEKTELLIFLTPRIIKQQPRMAAETHTGEYRGQG